LKDLLGGGIVIPRERCHRGVGIHGRLGLIFGDQCQQLRDRGPVLLLCRVSLPSLPVCVVVIFEEEHDICFLNSDTNPVKGILIIIIIIAAFILVLAVNVTGCICIIAIEDLMILVPAAGFWN